MIIGYFGFLDLISFGVGGDNRQRPSLAKLNNSDEALRSRLCRYWKLSRSYLSFITAAAMRDFKESS